VLLLAQPVPPGPAEDAVDFVNLDGEVGFFEQLGAAFPPLGFQAARLELPLLNESRSA